jgi:hypothetical protein
MAKSLFEARRESAVMNQELLQELHDTEHIQERPSIATAAGDHRKLRGIPAIGRGVSGHPSDSYVPGSDEHLEAIA